VTVYQSIIRYIEAHIKEEITLSDIADSVGYSANHIYKIFKLYSPYPVMEYIRRKKL
jgi:AraC family transcriptional regulator